MASDSRYLREGVIAGLIGAALVAVWFLIYDAASGRPFRTPSLLGAATFQGVTDPATVPTAAQPGRAVHGAARRGVRPDRRAHRLPDRLGPARAEPGADPVHRADVLRGVLPGGADLARAPGARRARLVDDPRRQRAGRRRHAHLLLRRSSRARARPAGAALDSRGARGYRGRAPGRDRGRALVPGLRRGRGGAPAHARPCWAPRSSTACGSRARW